MNQSELDCAENCTERSYFLESIGAEEPKTKEVQESAMCGGIYSPKQPAKDLLESGVCTSGWAPRATSPAEAGFERVPSGDKAKEGEDQKQDGVAKGSSDSLQQMGAPARRAEAMYKLFGTAKW